MNEEDILFRTIKQWWRTGKQLLYFYKQMKEVTSMSPFKRTDHGASESTWEDHQVIIEGEVVEVKRNTKHTGKPQVATTAQN